MIDKKINEKKDCMGCYACENKCPVNCIDMVCDYEGFWYPEVDYERCIKCNQCVDVCPIINKIQIDAKPEAYACININDDVRLNSSSGGIFTLIAEEVINQGGVVFGAGFNSQFEVEHSYVETIEELERLRGSKYVQSRIGEAYRQALEFLEAKREVLFSGTPCQIAGFKWYLGKDYENLICTDIICHGVPSPYVWGKYIKFREQMSGSKVQRIVFRNKNKGWRQYSVSFIFKDNKEYLVTRDKDSYINAFLKNVCLRPSCFECNFKGLDRLSDITLADFWGIQNIMPEIDDDKGTSLIFVNSNHGEKYFDKIKNSMIFYQVNIEKAIEYNSCAVKSVKFNPNRDRFMSEIDKIPFDKLVKKYCSDPLYIKIKRKTKALLIKILSRLKLIRRN